MQTYEQAISAGGSWKAPGGRFFMILSSTAPVDVTFFDNHNQKIGEALGVEASFKANFLKTGLVDVQGNVIEKDVYPESIKIESETAQTVKIGLSMLADMDYAVAAGSFNVNVTREKIFNTQNAQSYMVMQYLSGNATYNYTYHGLTNPAASGKYAYVQRMRLENVEVGPSSLKTMYLNGTTQAIIEAINTYAAKNDNFSKNIPVSTQNVCKPFTGRHNGQITTYYGAASTYSHENKDNGIELIKHEAIRLEPGYSIFADIASDVNVSSIIEWLELDS